MKRLAFAIGLLAILSPAARGGDLGLGLGRHGGAGLGLSVGLPGPGGSHGLSDFRGLGPLGFGFLGFGEHLQTRFENKFDALVLQYDTGLADIPDFYNSEEYTNVLNGVERLIDWYDLFLGGAERTFDRLGDIINIANDDLTYFTDLMVQFEGRDDLPENRLEQILARLTRVQDRLEMKIDLLSEKQTTLSENVLSYQTFSDELAAYLAQITAAAGGGGAGDAPLLETPQLETPAAAGVPEPSSYVLLAVAAIGLLLARRSYRPRAFALAPCGNVDRYRRNRA